MAFDAPLHHELFRVYVDSSCFWFGVSHHKKQQHQAQTKTTRNQLTKTWNQAISPTQVPNKRHKETPNSETSSNKEDTHKKTLTKVLELHVWHPTTHQTSQRMSQRTIQKTATPTRDPKLQTNHRTQPRGGERPKGWSVCGGGKLWPCGATWDLSEEVPKSGVGWVFLSGPSVQTSQFLNHLTY